MLSITGKVIEKDPSRFILKRMDQNSMEQIYKETNRRIYDFLYKFTNNPDTALDLLQDTYFNFFRQYKERELGKENIMKILYTIARNQSINHFNKSSTKREHHSEIESPDKKISFTKKLEYSDLEDRLQDCLQELSEDQRTALIMKNMNDMNLSQIAEIMGISIATVSRLVVKGTSNLLSIAEKRGIHL